MLMRISVLALALLAGPLVFAGCGREPTSEAPVATPSAPAAESTPRAARSRANNRPAAADPWMVGPQGAGPVRIGMTMEALRSALGLERGGPAGECEYVTPTGAPKGLTVMVAEGRVVRLDIARDSAASTSVGVHPGDREKRVRKLLGPSIDVTPHKYVEGGHYMTAPTSADETTWWVVETDGRRATAVRMGVKPQVDWVEGCS